MSSKLIFTVPDVDTCEKAVDLLRGDGITEDDIAIIGNSHKDLSNLPDGGTLENDSVPALQRGATIGGSVGLLGGLSAILIAPGLVVAGAAVALATVGGASVGALGAALTGGSVPNSRLREYEESIEQGSLLLVVDVEDEKRSPIQALLTSNFPGIVLEGDLDPVPPPI